MAFVIVDEKTGEKAIRGFNSREDAELGIRYFQVTLDPTVRGRVEEDDDVEVYPDIDNIVEAMRASLTIVSN